MRLGKQRARAEGLAEGRKEGRAEGIAESIKNLIANTGMTQEDAMDALGIPLEERDKYSALLA